MNTKTKRIYSSKVAGLLCRQGFRVIGTEPNPKKPWLDVFLFEDTEKFQNTLDIILSKISR